MYENPYCTMYEPFMKIQLNLQKLKIHKISVRCMKIHGVGGTAPFTTPMTPTTLLGRQNLFHNSQLPLLPDPFGFLGGTDPSPSRPLWTVPTLLPWSQPSLVLLPMQDKMEGEFFLQCLQTPSARSGSLLLNCLATEPLRRTIFGATSFIFC